MKCFVIAMESEARPVIDAMTVTKTYTVCDKKVTCGKIGKEKVAVVVCGVGKVNAASGTQYAIDCLGATTIINVGVAGGVRNTVKIAETYAVSAVVQYDFDLTQLNNTKIGTLDECKENYLKITVPYGFEMRRVATGDRFNDNPADRELIASVLGADIREMELGAIAQVCMHANVRCYSFKTISDVAGSGSTTQQFQQNLAKCAAAMAKNVEKIMRATV